MPSTGHGEEGDVNRTVARGGSRFLGSRLDGPSRTVSRDADGATEPPVPAAGVGVHDAAGSASLGQAAPHPPPPENRDRAHGPAAARRDRRPPAAAGGLPGAPSRRTSPPPS